MLLMSLFLYFGLIIDPHTCEIEYGALMRPYVTPIYTYVTATMCDRTLDI